MIKERKQPRASLPDLLYFFFFILSVGWEWEEVCLVGWDGMDSTAGVKNQGGHGEASKTGRAVDAYIDDYRF